MSRILKNFVIEDSRLKRMNDAKPNGRKFFVVDRNLTTLPVNHKTPRDSQTLGDLRFPMKKTDVSLVKRRRVNRVTNRNTFSDLVFSTYLILLLEVDSSGKASSSYLKYFKYVDCL